VPRGRDAGVDRPLLRVDARARRRRAAEAPDRRRAVAAAGTIRPVGAHGRLPSPAHAPCHVRYVRDLPAHAVRGARCDAGGGQRDGPRSKTLAIDGHVLHVWYRAEDRTTSLYADLGTGPLPTAAYALIEKIGARFNETLAHGQYQDLF